MIRIALIDKRYEIHGNRIILGGKTVLPLKAIYNVEYGIMPVYEQEKEIEGRRVHYIPDTNFVIDSELIIKYIDGLGDDDVGAIYYIKGKRIKFDLSDTCFPLRLTDRVLVLSYNDVVYAPREMANSSSDIVDPMTVHRVLFDANPFIRPNRTYIQNIPFVYVTKI